jgi:hypothetical protein
VEESAILGELLDDVQLARGRLYLWRESDDLMARITPLGPRSMLLESPRGNSWTERKRGQLGTVLKVLEGDTQGTFHGLGSLVAQQRGGKASAQVILHRDIKIPVRVLAEPRFWYLMHLVIDIMCCVSPYKGINHTPESLWRRRCSKNTGVQPAWTTLCATVHQYMRQKILILRTSRKVFGFFLMRWLWTVHCRCPRLS